MLLLPLVKEGGVAALVTTMSLGNELGFEFIKPFHDTDSLFTLQPGGMVLELAAGVEPEELFEGLDYMLLGHTTAEAGITINDTKSLTLRKPLPHTASRCWASSRTALRRQKSLLTSLCRCTRAS